jgi:hypothetical protein
VASSRRTSTSAGSIAAAERAEAEELRAWREEHPVERAESEPDESAPIATEQAQ